MKFNYVQDKLDGLWISAFQGRITSSIGTDLSRVVAWHDDCARILADRCNFFGELHVPGKPASSVKTAMIERWDDLRLTVFASVGLPSNAPLETVEALADEHGLTYANYQIIPQNFDYEGFLSLPLPQNVEGWVMKNSNLTNWAKWKPVFTVDVIVSGTTCGEGKYANTVGAIRMALMHPNGQQIEIGTCSGFSDDEREFMRLHNPTNRVAEIAYQYVGSQNGLRHPRFIRWRDGEKLPSECMLKQLTEDE
jgi:hypothetical protein